MTEAPELKPCPFCGGEAEYRVRNDENIWDHSQVRWVHVHCGNMDCDNYGFDWPEEAEPNSVERWNTRADLHTEAIEAAEQRGYARGIEDAADYCDTHTMDVPMRASERVLAGMFVAGKPTETSSKHHGNGYAAALRAMVYSRSLFK
jgi:hypothetical protein